MTATARRLDSLVSRERSFSADASHQLRTPLAGLRAAIESELSSPRPEPTVVLYQALSDIDRLERTIRELLTIARTPAIAESCISLADVFTDVEETWRHRVAMEHRRLRVASARFAPPVAGNAAILRHALDVLLDNALRHGAGMIAIDLIVTDESVTIGLSDEGPGFRSEPSANDESSSDQFDGAVHGPRPSPGSTACRCHARPPVDRAHRSEAPARHTATALHSCRSLSNPPRQRWRRIGFPPPTLLRTLARPLGQC